METVAQNGQLKAYKHDGFWQCMDTKREKEKLEELWEKGEAPWKVWKTEVKDVYFDGALINGITLIMYI